MPPSRRIVGVGVEVRAKPFHERRECRDTLDPRVIAGGLHISLDSPLPRELAVGAGTAVFVNGWCFHPAAAMRRLDFVLDGEVQPAMAHGMPRLDVFRAFHPRLDPFATSGLTSDPGSPDDPGLHSYRSGFWGIVRVVSPPAAEGVELLLRAELEGGDVAVLVIFL